MFWGGWTASLDLGWLRKKAAVRRGIAGCQGGCLERCFFVLVLHHVAFWFDLLDRQPRDELLVAYSHVTMAGWRGLRADDCLRLVFYALRRAEGG